jgi:hypothetical protein
MSAMIGLSPHMMNDHPIGENKPIRAVFVIIPLYFTGHWAFGGMDSV